MKDEKRADMKILFLGNFIIFALLVCTVSLVAALISLILDLGFTMVAFAIAAISFVCVAISFIIASVPRKAYVIKHEKEDEEQC